MRVCACVRLRACVGVGGSKMQTNKMQLKLDTLQKILTKIFFNNLDETVEMRNGSSSGVPRFILYSTLYRPLLVGW